MSLVLTRKAPLRVARGWSAQVVATEHGWHLAVSASGSHGAARPRYHALTKRRCLDILLAVKIAWRRLGFRRTMRRARTSLTGVYLTSEFIDVGNDLFGDYVLVLGTRLRTGRGVRKFRKGLVASIKLGEGFRRQLRQTRGGLAVPRG